MLTKKQLEVEMIRAQVSANRYMREASAHIGNQELWDLWQEAEAHAANARRRWQAAGEQEQQHAA